METTVTWCDSSKAECGRRLTARQSASRPDPARRAAELVDDTVTAIRNRGHTREHALRVAARVLGIGFRRARALIYGDPVALLDEELARIQAGYLRHLDAEYVHLLARLDAVREQRNRVSEEAR